jgi:hypothetical protein
VSSNPTAPTIPFENLLHASAAGFSFVQRGNIVVHTICDGAVYKRCCQTLKRWL